MATQIYEVSRDAPFILTVPCLIKFKDGVKFYIPGYIYEPVIDGVFCLKPDPNVISEADKTMLKRCNDVSCLSDNNTLRLMNDLLFKIKNYTQFAEVENILDKLKKTVNLSEAFKCYIECYRDGSSSPLVFAYLAKEQPLMIIEQLIKESKNDKIVKMAKKCWINRKLNLATTVDQIVSLIKDGGCEFDELAKNALASLNYEVFKFVVNHCYITNATTLNTMAKDLPEKFQILINKRNSDFYNRIYSDNTFYNCYNCSLPFMSGFKIIGKNICHDCIDGVFFGDKK